MAATAVAVAGLAAGHAAQATGAPAASQTGVAAAAAQAADAKPSSPQAGDGKAEVQAPGAALPAGSSPGAAGAASPAAPAGPADAAAAAAQGRTLYGSFCARCHGINLVTSGAATDLRRFPLDQPERFERSVLQGLRAMPAWGTVLQPAQVQAIWAYVASLR